MSVQDDLNPSALPFDRYQSHNGESAAGRAALHAVAMAKRILLQEKVRDFTAADVVALAAAIMAGGK